MRIGVQYPFGARAALAAPVFSIQCLAQSATPQRWCVRIAPVDLPKNAAVPGLKGAQ